MPTAFHCQDCISFTNLDKWRERGKGRRSGEGEEVDRGSFGLSKRRHLILADSVTILDGKMTEWGI